MKVGTRALFLCLVAGVLPLTLLAEPNRPQNSSSSTSRLRSDLEFLASDQLSGRATGSEGNARARRFLIERLHALGAAPLFEGGFSQVFEVPGRNGTEAISGANVVAVFPAAPNRGDTSSDPQSREPAPIMLISAHYDHLGQRGQEIFNGADDNASGVSALLEIGRQLSTLDTKSDIVLAFLDAEEVGLLGARSLVKHLSEEQIHRLTLNINLDMVGRSDGGALFVAGLSHNPALRETMEIIAKDSSVLLKFGHDTGSGSENWTLASDHAAFHRLGIPFLYFGVEDHEDYHRATDDSDRIDYPFLDQVTATVLQTVLAFQDTLSPAKPHTGR